MAVALQECAVIWSEILEGSHEWRRDVEVASEARTINRDAVLALFDTHFASDAPSRRAVISHSFSQAHLPQGLS